MPRAPTLRFSSISSRSRKSHTSLDTGDSFKVDRDEIRSVLSRHWTSLDRARLHTFHLWLFVYSMAQIFLFHYLCHRSMSIVYLCFCLIFPAFILVTFGIIRYGYEHSRFTLFVFSLLSSVLLPVFVWLTHLPLILELEIKQERVVELSSLTSALAISTFYQFFITPRRRRTFFLVSLIFNAANIILISLVLYVDSSRKSPKEPPIFTVSEQISLIMSKT